MIHLLLAAVAGVTAAFFAVVLTVVIDLLCQGARNLTSQPRRCKKGSERRRRQ